MNILPLAAVIAALAFPAAAQVPGPVAPAAAKVKGPTVPAGAWTEMLNKAMRDGRRDSETSDTRWLQEIVGDPAAEHTTRLLIVFLALDGNDRVISDGGALTLATFTWAPTFGGMLISESWELYISASGEVTEAAIVTRSGNPQRGFDVIGTVMVPPSDPRVKVRLDEMFKHWSARRP